MKSKNHFFIRWPIGQIGPGKEVGLKLTLEEKSTRDRLAYLAKTHRQAYKMTQSDLALRAGTTQSAIALIEAGQANPTLATIEAIAKVFNLRLELNFKRKRY